MIPSDFRDFFVSNSSLVQQEIVSSLLSLSLEETQVKDNTDKKAEFYLEKNPTKHLIKMYWYYHSRLVDFQNYYVIPTTSYSYISNMKISSHIYITLIQKQSSCIRKFNSDFKKIAESRNQD